MHDKNPYRTPCERTGSVMYRVISVTALSILLFLSGSVILVSAVPTTPARGKHRVQELQISRDVPQQITATIAPPTPTPLPTPKPTPRPTSVAVHQSPIKHLPAYFGGQRAVLMANGRLLYQGNHALPEVALTFDDGPNPPYTNQILAILQRYHIRATFFCVGEQVAAFPSTVRQEYYGGHIIGNHSYTHPYMSALTAASVAWQLSTTSDIIHNTIGVRPLFFRPPYGAYNSTVLTYANSYALDTTLWNDDPQDWSMPGVNTIVNRVLQQVGDGSIILMHDGGGNRWQTVAALPIIIEWLQSHGFRFVTMQQLVNDLHLKKSLSHAHVNSSLPDSYIIRRRVILA
jgi:peptidoglycan-N-acetylglucosamine deacetylase